MQMNSIQRTVFVLGFCITSLLTLRADDPQEVFKRGFESSLFIAVPARIMDKDVFCILDTGSTTCVLDNTFAGTHLRSVGKEQVGTATGNIQVERYERISQRCMGFPQHIGPAVSVDLSGFTVATGMQIDAFLGMDFLKPLIFHMNKGTPEFRQRTNFQPDTKSTAYRVQAIRGLPYINVGLPVLGDRDFLLDTGSADYCGVTSDYANQLIRSNDAVLLDQIPTLDASGVRKKNLYVIREIELFGITMLDVPAEESSVDVIGLGLMRQLNFSIDFENSVAHVLSPSRSVFEFDLDASGLRTVFRSNQGLVVRRIVPDSPAEKKSIKVGDQLLQIDGRHASDLSVREIRELLSQVGKTIPIKVKSGDRIRDIQLPLSRKFEYPPKWKPRSKDAEDFMKSLENELKR